MPTPELITGTEFDAFVLTVFQKPAAYNAATAYTVGNTVSYQGSTYQALAANTNVAPSINPPASSATWLLLVAAGSPGTAGSGGAAKLTSGSTLPPGNVVYNSAGIWKTLRPQDNDRGLAPLIGLVDKDGNILPKGSVADVTGLGLTTNTSYYVEVPDANGKTLTVLPSPVPASLQPSTARSYFFVGSTYTDGATMKLLFDFQAAVADGAVATYLNPFTGDGALGAEFTRGTANGATNPASIAQSGGVARTTATSGGDLLSYIGTGGLTDCTVQGTLTRGGGLIARYTPGPQSGYMFILSGNGSLYFVKLVAAGNTVLWSRENITVTSGTYKLALTGTSIAISENGTLLTTITDASYASGYAGLYMNASSVATVDDLTVIPAPAGT